MYDSTEISGSRPSLWRLAFVVFAVVVGAACSDANTPPTLHPAPTPAPIATSDPDYSPSTVQSRPLPIPTSTAAERAAAGDTWLYLTAFQNDYVSVVDPASGHAVHQIPVNADQAGMAISPDGTRLYVVDGTPVRDGRLRVFDTATWEIIHTEPVDDRLRLLGGNPISLSPDGRWLLLQFYSYELREGWVRVYDTQNLQFLPVEAWQHTDCAWSPVHLIGQPSHRYIYAHCGDFVLAMDATDLSPLWRAQAPKRSAGFSGVRPSFAASLDGGWLYGLYPRVRSEVGSDGSFALSYHDVVLLVWDADSGVVVDEVSMSAMISVPPPSPGRGNGAYVAVSPDGARIFAVWEDMIWAIDSGSLQTVDWLRLPAPVDGIAQSVDGRELYLLPATMGNLRVRQTGMFTVDAGTLDLVRHADDWPEVLLPFFLAVPAPANR